MRLTSVLSKQHLGRMFRRHWMVQGRKMIKVNTLKETVEKRGIVVKEANEVAWPKFERVEFPFVGFYDKPVPLDKSHPLWKDRPCNLAREDRVLLDGLPQAQLLTKTVHVKQTLPEGLEVAAAAGAPSDAHRQAKNAIMYSKVFDSEQKRLPKVIDPVRPAHRFPRSYGLREERSNFTLSNKLLSIVERHSEENCKDRMVVNDADITLFYENGEDLIESNSPSNALITACTPLNPITEDFEFTAGIELPNIYPLKNTISLQKKNIYEVKNHYPLSNTVQAYHPHTSYLLFNKTEVGNKHQTPVTYSQLLGRSLLHCFTIAASYAKEINMETDELKTPITVQCIQSNGKEFNFGIFQLNTLNFNDQDGIKNLWYSMPEISLFESCRYEDAIPTLKGYNPQVLNYLYALYNNK